MARHHSLPSSPRRRVKVATPTAWPKPPSLSGVVSTAVTPQPPTWSKPKPKPKPKPKRRAVSHAIRQTVISLTMAGFMPGPPVPTLAVGLNREPPAPRALSASSGLSEHSTRSTSSAQEPSLELSVSSVVPVSSTLFASSPSSGSSTQEPSEPPAPSATSVSSVYSTSSTSSTQGISRPSAISMADLSLSYLRH